MRFDSVCSCLLIVSLSLSLTTVSATDPTYCAEYRQESYDCECSPCDCQRCPDCSCEAKTRFWESCSTDDCDRCWCSALHCTCCYVESCPMNCNCRQCCHTCTRSVCSNLITYNVTSVQPATGPAAGGTVVELTGPVFVNSQTILCRFGSTNVPGSFLDSNTIRCTAPAVTMQPNIWTLTLTLEVSLDNGASWTSSGRVFTFYACPNDCSGHGTCNVDGTCHCDGDHWGTSCATPCPGLTASNQACSGNGQCLQDGTCQCDADHSGADCSRDGPCDPTKESCDCTKGYFGPRCANECPNGHEHPCNDHGACSKTGECYCTGAYWGTVCDKLCTGSIGITTNGTASIVPCSGHGVCTISGGCICKAGWVGQACNISCPSSNGSPCSGHGACHVDPQAPTSRAECVCDSGHFGADCSGTCPADSSGVPCSNRGVCSSSGKCSCGLGYYGEACQHECPGGASTPCLKRGLCDPSSGQCSCLNGYWGASCEFECPGGAGRPCSLFGICLTNGTCQCNQGYGGANCSVQVCPSPDCSGHGRCVQEGTSAQCRCDAGWLGLDCGTASASPTGNYSINGVLQFVSATYSVTENQNSLALVVSRTTGAKGIVSAVLDTEDVNAISNQDYIALNGFQLVWRENDTSTKSVILTIINDQIDEDSEKFRVVIRNVTGGAVIGPISATTITITGTRHDKLFVTVRFTVEENSIPPNSKERNDFTNRLTLDLSRILGFDTNRFYVQTIVGDADGILVTFELLPVAQDSTELTAAGMANKLVEAIGTPNSTLYQGAATQYIDNSYQPQVVGGSSPAPTSDGSNPTVGIAVGVTVAAILIIVGAVIYRKRRQVTEWLLWKLGNFRFHQLHKDRQSALETAVEELGSYNPQPEADNQDTTEDVSKLRLVPLGLGSEDTDAGEGTPALDDMPMGDQL